MPRPPFFWLSRHFAGFAAVSILSLLASGLQAAPLTTATVTKVENKVFFGERQGDRSARRPAATRDVMGPRNFLQSESESRAELQYADGTLVRVGQNSVFTFNSESRELSLDRGSLLFHMPKGAGGGTIKTASLTAAITGTAGKISDNFIAITDGSVRLIPSGRIVNAGEFARKNADGSITIALYDPAKIADGKLVDFNGHMPGFPEALLVATPPVTGNGPVPIDTRNLELLTRTQNLPSTVNHFLPTPEKEVFKKKDDDKPEPHPKDPVIVTPRPVATIDRRLK